MTGGEEIVPVAVSGLADIAFAFHGDLERAPTIDEMCSLITTGLRSASADLLDDVQSDAVPDIHPRLIAGARRRRVEDLLDASIDDLNDNTFVTANDVLTDLSERLQRTGGRMPTLAELCGVLARAVQMSDDTLLLDIKPQQLAAFETEVRVPRKARPKVGDIVAIPARNGDSFAAIVLARNTFGTALGLFDGTVDASKITADAHPTPRSRHIYTDDAAIASGRWPIVGHDDALRKLFPEEPEIYHKPRPNEPKRRGVPEIGPYGSAETADGTLRNLSQSEAEALGLLEPGFDYSFSPSAVEQHLNEGLEEGTAWP